VIARQGVSLKKPPRSKEGLSNAAAAHG